MIKLFGFLFFIICVSCAITPSTTDNSNISCGYGLQKVCSVYGGRESCSCEQSSQGSLHDNSPARSTNPTPPGVGGPTGF